MPKASRTQPTRRFRTVRGRPRRTALTTSPNSTDLGTPELIMKRAQNLTSEPIDICLQRGIIDENEHRAALHFRWLYTLRHGAPGVCAFDPLRGTGQNIEPRDDPAWRCAREKDYLGAVALLKQINCERLILSCVLHHEPPDFLQPAAFSRPHEAERRNRLAVQFSNALRQLNNLFLHNKKHSQAD